jgi:dihydrofolate reductase
VNSDNTAWSGYNDIYVDDGSVVQSVLSEQLLDELTLTRIPILLGGGVSLFGHLEEPVRPTHEDTTIVDHGLVKSRYRIQHD